jgi:hypothetical protein
MRVDKKRYIYKQTNQQTNKHALLAAALSLCAMFAHSCLALYGLIDLMNVGDKINCFAP